MAISPKKYDLQEIAYWGLSYFRRLRGVLRSNQPLWLIDIHTSLKRDTGMATKCLKFLNSLRKETLTDKERVYLGVFELSVPFLRILVNLDGEYRKRRKGINDDTDWKSLGQLKAWYRDQVVALLNPLTRSN